MLGLGRASQYAGWWATGENRAVMSLDFTTTALAQVRPRYYADYTGASESLNSVILAESPVTPDSPIDQTGQGTDIRDSVWSMTFRVGPDWAGTLPAGFQGLLGDYIRWYTDTQEIFMNLQIYRGDFDNNFTFFATGATSTALGTAWPTAWRERWLTLIHASSSDAGDFANWTATGANPHGWSHRFMLLDTQTQEVLHLSDSYAFEAAPAIDLTEAWAWNDGGGIGDITVSQFTITNNAIRDSADLDQVQILNTWRSFGDMFDPSVNAAELASVSPPTTIGGVRAWSRTIFTGVGTSIGSPVTGYEQAIPPVGQRSPDRTARIAVDPLASPLVPPEFRDYNA